MASSGLKQQRRTDETNRSSTRQVVSMRVFFTSRRKDFQNVRCIEAHRYEVERQLDTSCRATVQLRRNLTNAASIARNWTIARRIAGQWCRRVVALARFVMTRRTSACDPSLSTQRTYVTIANRTKERAKDHAKRDDRNHDQSKHLGLHFSGTVIGNSSSLRRGQFRSKVEIEFIACPDSRAKTEFRPTRHLKSGSLVCFNGYATISNAVMRMCRVI